MQFSLLKQFFPPLFIRYVESFEKISKFYSEDYRDLSRLVKLAEKVKRPVDRYLVEQIEAYNFQLGASEKTIENIYKLKHGASCIITGQQPSPEGGPLYNVYKAMTAIRLARMIEEKSQINCIPIFWNHSDDDNIHDFFKHTAIVDDRLVTTEYKGEKKPAYLYDLNTVCDFSSRLLSLFAEYGLVVVEPRILGEGAFFEAAIKNSIQIQDKLNDCSAVLETQGFKPSIDVIDWGGVYVIDENKRYRYKTDMKLQGRFSTSVFLRPLFQDYIFPTVSYVAGPNEISYFAHLGPLYEHFDVTMPAIFPRMSATVVPKRVERILRKFGLTPESIINGERPGGFSSEAVGKIKELKRRMLTEITQLKPDLKEVDMSLIGSLDKALKKMEEIADSFCSRVKEAIRNKDQSQSAATDELLNWLLPNGQLQERVLSSSSILRQLSLLDPLKEIDIFDFNHKFINLV